MVSHATDTFVHFSWDLNPPTKELCGERGGCRAGVSAARAVRAGNGSQWSGMGRELLASSPAFRGGVQGCADALAPLGLDLLAAFQEDDAWDDPILASVGLAAVQAWQTLG